MVERFSFGLNPISCLAWNKDKTQIALSPNNNEVHIYKRTDNDWRLIHVFEEHDLRVTGIDWAPNTNRIVTCSADRNAYVWSQGEDGNWKPTLVLLRINRAATCVKWSPKENKFAVGSGARLISVCYFEKENDWWVSKHIKKPIRSTVTCLDWHPNNLVLVAGSTDFRVRVFSAYIKVVEEPSDDSNPWYGKKGGPVSLGTLLAEFTNSSSGGGWIHDVSFSGDGNRICWVSHDSSLSVVDATRAMVATKLRTEFLPFLTCTWSTPINIIVAGHNCCPLLYSVDTSGQISYMCKLDNSQKKEAGGLSAMRKFQSLDRQARIENDTALETVHQNAITGLCIYTGSKGAVSKFSTNGVDGQLVVWDMNNLEKSIQNMRLD